MFDIWFIIIIFMIIPTKHSLFLLRYCNLLFYAFYFYSKSTLKYKKKKQGGVTSYPSLLWTPLYMITEIIEKCHFWFFNYTSIITRAVNLKRVNNTCIYIYFFLLILNVKLFLSKCSFQYYPFKYNSIKYIVLHILTFEFIFAYFWIIEIFLLHFEFFIFINSPYGDFS